MIGVRQHAQPRVPPPRMSRLDQRQLRLVAAIARHASLTRAAAELCISQPAASRQLTELEDSLGLLLFSRTPKAMVPTAAGTELLEHVWDEMADPFTNTVRVTVSNLRKKLGDPNVIETVPGRGYVLRS